RTAARGHLDAAATDPRAALEPAGQHDIDAPAIRGTARRAAGEDILDAPGEHRRGEQRATARGYLDATAAHPGAALAAAGQDDIRPTAVGGPARRAAREDILDAAGEHRRGEQRAAARGDLGAAARNPRAARHP